MAIVRAATEKDILRVLGPYRQFGITTLPKEISRSPGVDAYR